MFLKNQGHLQSALLSDLDLLTVKQRKRLDQSWAGTFRREVFARLDESPFAVLYTDAPSRPNIPVNVLVGLETLKAGQGWSDEEMHDEFSFGLQVRYALGYENLGEGEFDLRTVYNFRRRLSEHMRQTGQNLIAQAFRQITDAQVSAFQLKTHRLRMDTTQIASNIRRMSRVQLLVEILQRVQRMLNKTDQASYAEAFRPYLKGSSGQYVYQLKGEETAPHLQRMGELMHRLLVELAPAYGPHPTFQMLQRVFHEQFVLTAEIPQAKADEAAGGPPSEMLEVLADAESEPDAPAEISAASTPRATAPETRVPPKTPAVQAIPGPAISASSLLSPDDPEATFRRKGNQTYQGYVTNVTETCDPANSFQLIVQVQTSPNTMEDATLLVTALPDLKQRTGVEILHNDAGFCSPAVDQVLHEQHVIQIPTDLPGRAPNAARLGLADFQVQGNPEGVPQQLTCPQRQCLPVIPGRKAQWYQVRFAATVCQACPLQARCPSQVNQANSWRVLRFSQRQLDIAQRRQRCAADHQTGKNLRAAVEATVGALKRPFSDDQLPVRGSFRVGAMMIGSALMVNVRRIQRYMAEKAKAASEIKGPQDGIQLQPISLSSFLSKFWTWFSGLSGLAINRPSVFRFG